MFTKVRPNLLLGIGGLFLLFDQFLKYQAMNDWINPRLISGRFGWQPFANFGVAFSLPLPNTTTLFLSIPIAFLILYLLVNELKKKESPARILGLTLLFAGSLSNIIDRLFYKFVIDYILLLTGVINLGDAMIVAGLAMWVWGSRSKVTQ